MALNLDGVDNLIFTHSQEFAIGMGEERPGAATFVVSLDGTGDFDSIQEAIDALPTDGGHIYIKEGTYHISSTILVKSKVRLEGTGYGTVIYATGVNCMEIAASISQVTIEKIKFQEDAGGYVGIYIRDGDETIIRDCFFQDVGIGVYELNTAGKVIFCNNFCGDSAAYIWGDYSIIDGNIINVTGGNYAIRMYGDYGIITNNIGEGGGSAEKGIEVSGSRNLIVNNIMNNFNYGVGIEIVGATRNLIDGNVLYSNTTGAINDNGTNTQTGTNVTA